MTPWSRPALAAVLAFASPAGAAVCLPSGSMGPDVPGCTQAVDAKGASGAVGENLLALAGQAAAEQFNEREAIDAAGPLLPASASGRVRESARLRAGAASSGGLASTPSLASPLGDGKTESLDALAGAIVRGTGDSFSRLESANRTAAPAPAALSVSRSLAPAAPPPAPGGERANIGPTIRDEGRGAFDGASMGLPEDVGGPGGVVAPTQKTARRCTILNPCSTAD